MYRFTIHSKEDQTFFLAGQEFHHMVHVLRMRQGDKVIGIDNDGTQWLGVIESIDKEKVCCRILAEDRPDVEAKTNVYIVMGLAKGEKMEWVIQKGTELGMSGFVPLRTKRSVVQLEGKKAKDRVVRWQKIATEAVKQSRRVIKPEIFEVCDWDRLADILPTETQWLIPYEEEKKLSFSNTLQAFDPNYPIAILIGPEGGFTQEEVEQAKKVLSARSVSLGPRVLRTETAALAALVMVLAYFRDIG